MRAPSGMLCPVARSHGDRSESLQRQPFQEPAGSNITDGGGHALSCALQLVQVRVRKSASSVVRRLPRAKVAGRTCLNRRQPPCGRHDLFTISTRGLSAPCGCSPIDPATASVDAKDFRHGAALTARASTITTTRFLPWPNERRGPHLSSLRLISLVAGPQLASAPQLPRRARAGRAIHDCGVRRYPPPGQSRRSEKLRPVRPIPPVPPSQAVRGHIAVRRRPRRLCGVD